MPSRAPFQPFRSPPMHASPACPALTAGEAIWLGDMRRLYEGERPGVRPGVMPTPMPQPWSSTSA